MRKQLMVKYDELISLENLLAAWREFLLGKRKRADVQEYQMNLMDNIISLHESLANKTYIHGGYRAFNISDPKPRNIHKASVGDRLLHHAIYRMAYPFFQRTFIADSFSCQLGKGTHKAMDRFRGFFYKVSKNNTRTCFALKMDIRKFFANVDHGILLSILKSHIPDQNIIWLLERVVESFSMQNNKGLPLGNLTSQLFVNIYMNEFDQFVKHKSKAKYYIRYCDDFVVLSEDRIWLKSLLPDIGKFLSQELGLQLHPNKIFLKTVSSGLDFLGWVNFHDHRILRTATKRRMIKRIKERPEPKTLNSYLGLIKHGNTSIIENELLNNYLLWKNDPESSIIES